MNKIKTFFVVTLLAVVAVVTFQGHSVGAANSNDFNPGYIIDDYVFYNSNAMSADQIQNFLNSKVPVCDTQGTGPSGYGNTRAQYAESRGWHGPPYTCLRDYKQNTPQMEAASGLCGALSAKSNSTSAQIIRDVAAACSINPQVLVILLEKEQSLITDVWPLDIQLRNATGFACPDTAPCNPQYEGFFYQIYYAARQFKIYQAYPDSYNYRAGRSNNIYWHPDMARCGSSSVYIQNQATAALYIYTPYRPNQAALNNLYGTGDGCSSYGNRNFWRLFTDWFGSTKVNAGFNEINTRYNQLGGANGALGTAVSQVTLVRDGVSYQIFQNGTIVWRIGVGAWETMNGPIRDRWITTGGGDGLLGSPTGPLVTENSNKRSQQFQNGYIIWNNGIGAWESVNGQVRNRWISLGASGGTLGAPIGPIHILKDGRTYQHFERGAIFLSQDGSTGAWESVNGAIRDRWAALGGSTGALGMPVGPLVIESATKQSQQFQNGYIIWNNGIGAWESLKGEIRSRWVSIGASSSLLGAPAGPVVNESSTKRSQQFQNGYIIWNQNDGAWESVNGQVRNRWISLGASGGTLGSPVGPLVIESATKQSQQFQNGYIIWNNGIGAWESVNGAIRDHWVSAGASGSTLGAPAGPIIRQDTNNASQKYQNGTIFWNIQTGARSSTQQ